MNIPKPRAAEYLGVRPETVSKMIKRGELVNADHYHITLDSLVQHLAGKSKPIVKENNKKPVIQATIESMRIEDERELRIKFTSDKSLHNFVQKLNAVCRVVVKSHRA